MKIACLPKIFRTTLFFASATAMAVDIATPPIEYPYQPYNQGLMDPQIAGWPIGEEQLEYINKPDHTRRPGSESNQHLPKMWPVTPAAGGWDKWINAHEALVRSAQDHAGPVDILLIGDSITWQWLGMTGTTYPPPPFNAAWSEHFGDFTAVNSGIGGDRIQNVLWRLDHGAVDGLEPKLIVLAIGNNNMFFTRETGIEAAAEGIATCVENLRARFPKTPVIVVTIFPSASPGTPFYEDSKATNEALLALELEKKDPLIRILDPWDDMVNSDGTLKTELFQADLIHLSQEDGYRFYAEKLKPLVEEFLGPEKP